MYCFQNEIREHRIEGTDFINLNTIKKLYNLLSVPDFSQANPSHMPQSDFLKLIDYLACL